MVQAPGSLLVIVLRGLESLLLIVILLGSFFFECLCTPNPKMFLSIHLISKK